MKTENQFFIWEEKNSTDQKKNSLPNAENGNCGITTETKKDLTKNESNDILKKCKKCQTTKPLNEFNKSTGGKYGVRTICKSCRRVYRFENRDIIKSYNEKYKLNELNKIKIKNYDKSYYEKNKEKLLKYRKMWSEKNKLKLNEYSKNYHKTKREININFKIKDNMRSRLYQAIKYKWKCGSSIEDLGCSIEELKKYLESKFSNGMTWENYGKRGWHIDHIKPLISFDLTDRKQFLEACHYTNLQPLWWYENLSKSDKII